MYGDVKLTAATVELETRCPAPGSKWRHRSGGVYHVVGPCIIEATLTPAVSYVSDVPDASQIPWVRPLDEFLDGRFTPEPE